MSGSTVTAFSPIPENSDGTPGLWNSRFQALQDNIVSVNSVVISPVNLSLSTWASIGLTASSNNSDYIRFVDSSGQRSTYRVGSNAGGTADGFNIYDESGSTMLVSFSKQSIRFYQNIVGPVFDVGGALANTLNAATFGSGTDSKETRIQAAIIAAANSGISRVYVPSSLLPYSASSVSFIYTVQMTREGGASDLNDLRAYGAAGNNVQDDTASFAAAVRSGPVVYIPAGQYKTSSAISFGTPLLCTRLFGTNSGCTIRPTSAVTRFCLQQGSSSVLEGIALDGSNTTGCVGLDLGTDTLVNLMTVRDCQVWNFKGGAAYGIKLGGAVTASFANVYCVLNGINLWTTAGVSNAPTDTIFYNCQFRQATTKGVWIELGNSINFLKCLFESNGEEGFYVQNIAGTVLEIRVSESWFETNWLSVTAGAARHAKYELYVDGANGPSGTIRTAFRDLFFNADATSARAMHLTNAIAYLADSLVVRSEAAQILVDGTSYGKFTNWLEQSGAFRTTVSAPDYNDSAWNNRSHLEDNIEAAWTDWTPAVTASGSMTIASLIVRKARYQIIGKTLKVKMYLGFTTGGTASTTVSATLPTNARTLDANEYPLARLTNSGAGVLGAAHADGANPTSSIAFTILAGGNWALTTNQEVLFYGEFELF